MPIIHKIIKFGNSYAVVIPRPMLEEMELAPKDIIAMGLTERNALVLVKFQNQELLAHYGAVKPLTKYWKRRGK